MLWALKLSIDSILHATSRARKRLREAEDRASSVSAVVVSLSEKADASLVRQGSVVLSSMTSAASSMTSVAKLAFRPFAQRRHRLRFNGGRRCLGLHSREKSGPGCRESCEGSPLVG